MVTTHNLGFPRIGTQRELKWASEAYWRGELTQADYLAQADNIHRQNTQQQIASGLDYVPLGDFSLYDQVLDTSFWLGNLPARSGQGVSINNYFRAARGRSACGDGCIAGVGPTRTRTSVGTLLRRWSFHRAGGCCRSLCVGH